MTCRVIHLQECAKPGWVEAIGMDGIVQGVRPCEHCMPGKHALWKAGMAGVNIRRDKEAARIYNEAMIAAGQPPAEVIDMPKPRKTTEPEEEYE